jgi:hypothetical protein
MRRLSAIGGGLWPAVLFIFGDAIGYAGEEQRDKPAAT